MLSDEELSDEELSDEELSDDELSDNELSNNELLVKLPENESSGSEFGYVRLLEGGGVGGGVGSP